MNFGRARSSQRGATLIVGLVMLLLLTLMVGATFTMSGNNLKAVGNIQSRSEALAAANSALDLILGTPFTESPASVAEAAINVDINNDSVYDYDVVMTEPECVAAYPAEKMPPSSVTLPVMGVDTWNTVWDIKASVQDPVSDTNLSVRAGVRVLLTEVEKNLACAP